jgi:hypothetical protein
MLKHCAANRKRRLSALPNLGPYIYMSKFLALQGAPHIYDISRLRVNKRTWTWCVGRVDQYSDWLRAGRPGDRIPVGGEIFRTCPERPGGPPSLLNNGYRVFPGGWIRPGRDAEPSPPSSAEVWKRSRAISLLSLRAFVACKKGETYPHIKHSSGMRRAEHVAAMGEGRGVYRVLVGKREGKWSLGRPRCRGADNITMDLHEMGGGGMDWIELVQDRDRWRVLLTAVMNLRVP